MKSRPGFCYWRINLILFRLFAEAHEPVQTILIFVLGCPSAPCYAAAAGGGYDDIIAGPPVRRGGAGIGVRFLERQNDALDLVKVAARGQRIVQDGSYHAVGSMTNTARTVWVLDCPGGSYRTCWPPPCGYPR